MKPNSFYQQHFCLQDATFSLIDHNDAMVAIVYKVTCKTGEQFILKICSRAGEYQREVYFLNHLAGTLPVPRIIQTFPPEANIDGAILMEYVPGRLLSNMDCTDALAYESGLLLACIHLNRTAGYGDPSQSETLSTNLQDYFIAKFQEGVDECRGHLPDVLIAQCQKYFDEQIALLDHVDGPCIVHRDFRPGNLIVHDGRIQGIIDWASGRASFAQEDFCSLEHGEWLTNQAIKKSFLAGYASIRSVPEYQNMMPLLRMNRAFASIGFMVKRGIWQASSHINWYQSNLQFLETFLKEL